MWLRKLHAGAAEDVEFYLLQWGRNLAAAEVTAYMNAGRWYDGLQWGRSFRLRKYMPALRDVIEFSPLQLGRSLQAAGMTATTLVETKKDMLQWGRSLQAAGIGNHGRNTIKPI